jgi:hypothetical protein
MEAKTGNIELVDSTTRRRRILASVDFTLEDGHLIVDLTDLKKITLNLPDNQVLSVTKPDPPKKTKRAAKKARKKSSSATSRSTKTARSKKKTKVVSLAPGLRVRVAK